MQKLLGLFKGHTQYITIAIYVMIAVLVITLLVSLISSNLRFVKYLPGLVLIFLGVASIFSVINKLFDAGSINYLVIFVIATGSGILSILFALIIGIIKGN